MKSQIFNTFLFVLVAQSQVAFAEPQPLLGDLFGEDGLVGGLVGGPDGVLSGLTGDDEILDELLGHEGLLGGIVDTVFNLLKTTLSVVLELLNNLLCGFDSGMSDITANALNTLKGISGIWDDTLAAVPLVMERAVEDAHQLTSNIMDTLSNSIINAIGNKLTLASSIIDALKNTLNNIADDFVIPDVIAKLLAAFGTVTCSVFDSVLHVLVIIPNIPEGVTNSIETACSVLNRTHFGYINQLKDVINPSLEPLNTISPLLLDNLNSIVTATGISDLIETNPDISIIKIPLTPTTNDSVSTLVTNLNYANSLFQQAIQTLTNAENAGPDFIKNALNVVFTLIPNTNCSNNIESSKASITDNSISNLTACIDTTITSLQAIMNQYTSIINDINSSTSAGFLKATPLDSYIKMVANSGAVIFNTIFGFEGCLAHKGGLAVIEFVKLIVDSIHCLAGPAEP